MKEQSYVMVKPEFANYPSVIAEVKNRLKEEKISILKCGYVNYTKEAASKHYAEHLEKPFYPNLEKYITSDVAYGMVVEGENAIATIRKLAGSTKNPDKGTIRYDIPKVLGLELRVTENVVHSSSDAEAAQAEIAIFLNLLEKENNISL